MCINFLLIANDTTILAFVTGVMEGLALFKQLLTGNLLIKGKKKKSKLFLWILIKLQVQQLTHQEIKVLLNKTLGWN